MNIANQLNKSDNLYKKPHRYSAKILPYHKVYDSIWMQEGLKYAIISVYNWIWNSIEKYYWGIDKNEKGIDRLQYVRLKSIGLYQVPW